MRDDLGRLEALLNLQDALIEQRQTPPGVGIFFVGREHGTVFLNQTRELGMQSVGTNAGHQVASAGRQGRRQWRNFGQCLPFVFVARERLAHTGNLAFAGCISKPLPSCACPAGPASPRVSSRAARRGGTVEGPLTRWNVTPFAKWLIG